MNRESYRDKVRDFMRAYHIRKHYKSLKRRIWIKSNKPELSR
jgi:hypothetical protein